MKHGNKLLKRLLACALAVCTCAAFMTSCGNDDSSSSAAPADSSSAAETTTAPESSAPESSEADDSQAEEVTPIDVTQGATEEMLERAYIYNGDLSRLAAVIKRAQDDRLNTTNICYFGDSISAGSGASKGSKSYGELFKAWVNEKA